MPDRDRPSTHGAILGEFLATLAEAGRAADPSLPEPCSSCAFRRGSMPNQMGATTLAAFHCTLGTDPAPFGCHYGMDEHGPTRMCAGYAAARLAPHELVKAELEKANDRLGHLPAEDEVRAKFDRWVAKLDPENKMDDYARARAYAKDRVRV